MNERIRELALQAGAIEAKHITNIPSVLSLNGEEIEKFAELIVRECIKEIEFLYEGGSDRPIDDEWDRAIECASSMVKYRFGVEE